MNSNNIYSLSSIGNHIITYLRQNYVAMIFLFVTPAMKRLDVFFYLDTLCIYYHY